MMRIIAVFLFAFLLEIPSALAMPKTQRICLNTESGKMTVRRRCRSKKNEQELSVSNFTDLVVQQNPAPIKGYGLSTTTERDLAVNAGTGQRVTALCPGTKKVLGGECNYSGNFVDIQATGEISPFNVDGSGNGWSCVYANISGGDLVLSSVIVNAICADAEPDES